MTRAEQRLVSCLPPDLGRLATSDVGDNDPWRSSRQPGPFGGDRFQRDSVLVVGEDIANPKMEGAA
jgi:hypothetical protein